MPTSESSIGHHEHLSLPVNPEGESVFQYEDSETLHPIVGRDVGAVAIKFAMSEWQGNNDPDNAREILSESLGIDQRLESLPSPVQQMTRRMQMKREEFGRRYASLKPDQRSGMRYDSWRRDVYDDTSRLTDPNAEPSQLAELIQELGYSAEYEAATFNDALSKNYDDVLRIVNHIPEENLRSMYLSNKDAESGALRHLLHKVVSADDTLTYQFGQPLKIMKKIYPANDALEVMTEHKEDKVVDALRNRSDYAHIMLGTMPSIGEDFSRDKQDLSGAQREWSERYLQECINLPESLADDYLFASFSRLSKFENEQPTGLVNEGKLHDSLSRIEVVAREISPEKLMLLREKAGIVNIDNYTSRQLNDTYKFVSSDPEYIEKLQAGDTTLVLTDAKGDWNGGMASTPQVFDNETANVLFFEINQQSDPYRAFAMCRRAHVQPSRVVIGAHGSPGNMWFGNKSEASNFVISNQLPSIGLEAGALYDQTVMPLMSAESLARIADEYMQDSRGVNDNQELVGRRQIILKSCSQAVPREVTRMVNGEQSIAQESTAETFAKVIGHKSVDIYAAAAPVSSHATEMGMNYKGGDKRDIYPATKMTIDENGQLVTTTVDEIVLWHDHNKQEAA